MFRLSKKLLFAIEAVVDIAYNAGGTPVQSSEITRRQGIPRRYLEQVLQHLVRAGILSGVRGPRGGYRNLNSTAVWSSLAGSPPQCSSTRRKSSSRIS